MAILALLAELPLMRVFATVAVMAGRRRLMIFLLRCVTGITTRAGVAPAQRVVGCGVIEGLRVEQYQGCVTAVVLGMAAFALACFRLRNTAVESCAGLDIARNVFVVMTFHAVLVLKRLLQQHMAVGTVVFEFGVRLVQRARHQRLFHAVENICMRGGRVQ